jgi:hypothetical protein
MPQLQVKVANGTKIQSAGWCNSLFIKVQGVTITSEFYVITLGGCNIVLGVACLRTLGPIIWDFLLITMQYSFNGKSILLTGLHPTSLTLEDGNNFLKASNSSNIGIWLQLLTQEAKDTSLTLQALIRILLAEFALVFNEPMGLPLARGHDHQIFLKGNQSITVCSYRYPYFQKTEIEKIVRELLDLGVIKLS